MIAATLLLAILPLGGLVADVQGTLAVGDFSQALWRPEDIGPGRAVDVETAPLVGLGLATPSTRLTLSYSPRFTLRDALASQPQPMLFQNGLVSLGYSRSPRASFTLTEAVSYGQVSLLTQALAPTPTGQALPTPSDRSTPADPNAPPDKTATPDKTTTADRTATADASMSKLNLLASTVIYTIAETTSANVGYAWSRRLRSSFLVSYGIAGGLDKTSQLSQLLQHTAATGSTLSYALTRQDNVGGTLNLSYTTLSNGYDHWIAFAGTNWTHIVSKDLSTLAALGLSFTDSREAMTHRFGALLPSATAGLAATLARGRESALNLTAGAGLNPVVDPVTGKLETRVQGLTALVATRKKTSASINFDVAETVPLPSFLNGAPQADHIRIVGLGAAVIQGVGEALDLSLRYRSIWQHASGLTRFDRPYLWIASVAVTLRGPPLKF